jgi:hypothetical protein
LTFLPIPFNAPPNKIACFGRVRADPRPDQHKCGARYTRPNTRTPPQLRTHLQQAPVGLPDGPTAAAADDAVTFIRARRGAGYAATPRRRIW